MYCRPAHWARSMAVCSLQAFAANMATIGLWTRKGVMDEEWLLLDNRTLAQLGLS
jgi:hypothetical protein